jgi:hypothetical protein
MQTQVTNLSFKAAGSEITVNSLQYNAAGAEDEIPALNASRASQKARFSTNRGP